MVYESYLCNPLSSLCLAYKSPSNVFHEHGKILTEPGTLWK